jgi:hypothetical protein
VTGVVPADEGRHRPGPAPGWEERWHLDFATDDGALGGYVHLALLPARGRSRVWASLVGEGRRLVTMVEPDAPLPRAGALDLRCEGLWTDLVCETPLEHWSVGLEAFGVALDDPADAHRGLRGERIGLGFDLEWERSGPVAGTGTGGPSGYLVPCEVHGEVLVGAETIAFEGWGTRSHAWGDDPWAEPWAVAAGRSGDGERWHAVPPDGPIERGEVGPDGLPERAEVVLGGRTLVLEPRHPAPVPVTGPGGEGRLGLALCRVTSGGGSAGSAWAAWHRPGR